MEVKINREIRNYTESMFFGLSLRQFIFSACACVVAVGLYFLLKPHLGTETVSWVCILGAAPFAALGFLKYNGMTAEKFICTFVKSEFIMPKKLTFRATNTYYELMKPSREKKTKEAIRWGTTKSTATECRSIKNCHPLGGSTYHFLKPFAKLMRLSSCSLLRVFAISKSSFALDGLPESSSKKSFGVIPR